MMRSNPRALSFGIDCVALPVRRTDRCTCTAKGCPTPHASKAARRRASPTVRHQGSKLGRVDSLTMSKEPEPEGKVDESKDPETDPNDLSPADVKIILLGDSAVGKTKLVERFLMDEYNPQQLST